MDTAGARGDSPIVNWAKARRPLASRTWRMLAWAFLPLAFFTASIGKQPRYILPILPPLAVLLAATIMDRVRARSGRDVLLQEPPSSPRCSGRFRSCSTGPNTLSSVPTVFIFAAIIAIAVAAAVVRPRRSRAGSRRARRRGHCRRAHAGGAQCGLSPGGRDPVQDMAILVAAHRTLQEPIASYRVFVRNLVFYTGVKQTDLRSDQQVVDYLQSTERVLCVIDEKNLQRLEEGAGFKTIVLGEVLYFNASAVKLRTFLHRPASRPRARAARRQPVTATERTRHGQGDSRHGDRENRRGERENMERSRVPLPAVRCLLSATGISSQDSECREDRMRSSRVS